MDIKEKISNVIEEIRPALIRDGGDMEVVDYIEDEKSLLVKFTGACGGCPMKAMTFHGFIEGHIKEQIPEIKEVRLV